MNFPITDTLFARVGLASEQMDGYYYNRHLNVDVGGTDATTANMALRWQPSDNWTFDFNTFLIRRRDGNLGIQCNPYDGSAGQWGGGAGNIERLYPGAKQEYYDTCAEDASIGAFVNSSNKLTFANIDDLRAGIISNGSLEQQLAKLRRTGICGAAETLLVDRACQATHLKPLVTALLDAGREDGPDPGEEVVHSLVQAEVGVSVWVVLAVHGLLVSCFSL